MPLTEFVNACVMERGSPHGKYGFPDRHVELIVKLPLIFRPVVWSGIQTEVFDRDEAKTLHEPLKKAILWSDLDGAERERIGAES